MAICMKACRNPTTTTNHDEWFECENGPHLRQAIKFIFIHVYEYLCDYVRAYILHVHEYLCVSLG